MTGMAPLQPRPPNPRDAQRSSEPSRSKPQDREFKLPKEKEGNKEQPKEEVIEAFEKDQRGMVEGVLQQQQAIDARLSQEASGEISKVSTTELVKAADQIAKIIKQMVEAIRVGSIEGKQVTNIELKQSADFLSQANINITQLGDGRIAVAISNLSDANLATAIAAVEQNKQALDKLSSDLQVKGIALTEVRIGDQIVFTTTTGAQKPLEAAPLGTSQEGYRERDQEKEKEEENPR